MTNLHLRAIFKKLLGFMSFFKDPVQLGGNTQAKTPNLPDLGVKIRSNNGQLNASVAIFTALEALEEHGVV